MLKGYIRTAILFALACLSFSKTNECDYICDADGCKTSTNNSSTSISSAKYCAANDIPNDVNFSVIQYDGNETSEIPALVQINFTLPKRDCKYDITLLANESIKERKCVNYNFQNFNGIETHTRATICFLSNDNQRQNVTGIFFPYIFTACYSVQFFYGKNVKRIKGNKFIKTSYKRTEVTKPIFECTYEIIPDIITDVKQVHLEMSSSISVVKAVMFRLGSLCNDCVQEVCDINKEDLRNSFQIFNILDNYIEDKYQHSNEFYLENGKYKKEWKFQTNTSQKEIYCFRILYHDVRCKEKTLWNPPTTRCNWYQSCQNITLYKHIGVQASTDADTVSYLYLPITMITLIILAVVGLMYLTYALYTCNIQGTKFYRNICNGNIIKSNHTTCTTANTCTLKDEQKVKYKDISITNTDIILLYPKGPESFMTLMADFRGIISRTCGSVVHDWYDGVEWNYVAEIGASDWFAETLNKGSRVIWIDTPEMRSLIIQRFKKDPFVRNSHQSNFVTIGDFRDAVLPMVFNLSRRNMEQSVLEPSRHFIVRLKGFEFYDNDNDPFVDLSPRVRYCIPQDLKSLCSDLLVVESDIVIPCTNQEEELIRQHLHYVKSEFYK